MGLRSAPGGVNSGRLGVSRSGGRRLVCDRAGVFVILLPSCSSLSSLGQRVVPGPITKRTDHDGLLRRVEDLYGLPPLGHSAAAIAIAGLCHAST